jgi:hypothetical protein
MRSLPSACAGDAGGVEHEGGGGAGDELGDAAQRVGVVEAALQFGVMIVPICPGSRWPPMCFDSESPTALGPTRRFEVLPVRTSPFGLLGAAMTSSGRGAVN